MQERGRKARRRCRCVEGAKVNVIPSELQLELDGRLLPGQTADDLFRELAGDEDLELEALSYEPGSARADLSLMGLLSDVLTAADPDVSKVG